MRQLSDHPRIAADPRVCGGRPVVAGTRVRVVDVLDMLSAGVLVDTIVEDFPYLTRDDVHACVRYAASMVDHPIVNAAE